MVTKKTEKKTKKIMKYLWWCSVFTTLVLLLIPTAKAVTVSANNNVLVTINNNTLTVITPQETFITSITDLQKNFTITNTISYEPVTITQNNSVITTLTTYNYTNMMNITSYNIQNCSYYTNNTNFFNKTEVIIQNYSYNFSYNYNYSVYQNMQNVTYNYNFSGNCSSLNFNNDYINMKFQGLKEFINDKWLINPITEQKISFEGVNILNMSDAERKMWDSILSNCTYQKENYFNLYSSQQSQLNYQQSLTANEKQRADSCESDSTKKDWMFFISLGLITVMIALQYGLKVIDALTFRKKLPPS